MSDSRVLVYGYGNPGRQDDGLGVEFVTMVENENYTRVDCDSNYQLNVEDALTVSRYDTVIFVDASLNARAPFEFLSIQPSNEISFTTHAMSAQSVLALCEELYGKRPAAYMLGIRGYTWDPGIGLTAMAKSNLKKAFDFINALLNDSSTDALERAVEKYSGCVTC